MSLTTIDSKNIFLKDAIGNVRTAQEDSHNMAATPNGDVFVVCDGMGGHVGGQEASHIAVESIIGYLKKRKYSSPIQALDEALQFANMQILGYTNEHPELKGMGTTACILLLQGDEAYIAHVGDSRIYLYLGKEKQLHRITKDHSFVQTLVDAGKITDEEAEFHPNKNRISKVLGIKPELQPTFNYQNKPIFPKKGDIFLICSDGLNGMISDCTIKSVLSQKTTIEQKGNMLISLALQGENGQPGGQDNITVELIRIDNSPWKKSVFTSYNPKSKSQMPVSKSGKLMNIVELAVAIIVVFMVSFGGGIYFYGNHKRTSALQNERNEFEKSIKDLQIIDNKQDITKISDEKLISLYEDEINNLKPDTVPKDNKIENDIKEFNNRIQNATPSTKSTIENEKKNYEENLKEIRKKNEEWYKKKADFETIVANYIKKRDSIKKEPFYKFLIFKNESNNNRKNSR